MKDQSPKGVPATLEKAKPARAKSKIPKLIELYYAELAELAHQNVMYEMGTRTAFHNLLAGAGRVQHWTLIPELERKANGKTIRPDGTFKDAMNLVRGYWEAKDPGDDLDAEIVKKRKVGYPVNNIIFEDTLTAVLYQHGSESMRVDMKDPKKLEDLIVQFFRHVEPQIEEFEEAVDEFKEKVPDLAEGLKKKIELAHKSNPAFKKAFADFFELCRTSLNPNLSEKAVDEMLIQHILTERLIREIFDNPEFVRRNVIAAEVEKVMQAMTSTSFDRNTYLKELDRFYVAIEMAAQTMIDFSDKQHFLNTVYERFFQGYSVKLADTMGIVYTPQAIVDFMCASVAEVLEKEFGKKLWSDDVYIIDPCTGTGNFIVNLIRRMPKAKLPEVYKHRLFANEIMLLPYYIASLNIEHAYYEQTGTYEGFEGLCFVDTLDLTEHAQAQLGFMTAANTARVERQKRAPITVIIGNPPYNVGQKDENDDNRNREYEAIDKRIRETYIKDGTATLRMQLYDPYVKFLRWSSDRLGDHPGIVCMVTNNGFLRGTSFDGLRQHLRRDFDSIHHFDLKGNARTAGERRRQEGGNVFSDQIRAGIGISVFTRLVARRSGSSSLSEVRYHAVSDYKGAGEKIQHLLEYGNLSKVPWVMLYPDSRGDWLVPLNASEFDTFAALGTKEVKAGSTSAVNAIFIKYGSGVKTNSDAYVYDFSRERLIVRADAMVENFNSELDRWKRKGQPSDLEGLLVVNQNILKWIRNTKRTLLRGKYLTAEAKHTRVGLYRPFDLRFYFFHRAFSEDTYQFPRFLPTASAETENRVICVPGVGNRKGFGSFVSRYIVSLDLAFEKVQCFPFYIYDEDGLNRRENITDWSLNQFRTHYRDKKIDKWSIFHYVYGMLHHPGYREKFADNLKRELPRIPFAADFWAFAEAGKALAALHLDYEKSSPWELEFVETPGVPLSYRVVDKMRLSKDKARLVVNPSLALAGIPAEAFEYRLGNRSAVEWVIDQYQVCTDARSGITSDPNREDDPQYIVRLVGQVIRVSVETVRIVKGLPKEYAVVE
jgi:predicted helicase